MFNACQIPYGILQKLTTEDLVEICLNYPLAFDYILSNNERENISWLIENFNGLKELSKRSDGGHLLMKIYKDAYIGQTSYDGKDNKKSIFYFGYLELLIADDSFINSLSSEDMEELKKVTLDKYDLKLNSPVKYGFYDLKRSFLLGSVVVKA